MLNETRQARRVYIGNLPGSVPPQEVVDFFNDAMVKAGLNKWAGPPIVQAVHQSLEGGFVFIELRDVDETTALLMYDGVIFKDRQLKVHRPADTSPHPHPDSNPNPHPHPIPHPIPHPNPNPNQGPPAGRLQSAAVSGA